MKSEDIARICHEANRAYCQALGDESHVGWQDAPAWQRESAQQGVMFVITHPDLTPEQAHENWMRQKSEDGWKYGPVKDAEKKEHPCMVGYVDLPLEQRLKDYLFCAIVLALTETV